MTNAEPMVKLQCKEAINMTGDGSKEAKKNKQRNIMQELHEESQSSDLQGMSKATRRDSAIISAVKGWTRKIWVRAEWGVSY